MHVKEVLQFDASFRHITDEKTDQNTGKSTIKETLIFFTAYGAHQVGFKAIKGTYEKSFATALEAKSSVATDPEAAA